MSKVQTHFNQRFKQMGVIECQCMIQGGKKKKNTGPDLGGVVRECGWCVCVERMNKNMKHIYEISFHLWCLVFLQL